MNKGCRELDVFVGTKMEIADTGREVLYAIIGMMSETDNESEFNTCKELLDKALLNLIAFEDEIIPQEDFARFLELLEACEFEDEEEEGVSTAETNIRDAANILRGMVLYDIHPLCSDRGIIGKAFIFRTNEEEGVGKLRTLSIQDDGRVYISEEY